MDPWHWPGVLSDNKTWGKLEFDLRWLYIGQYNGSRNFLEGLAGPGATQDGAVSKLGSAIIGNGLIVIGNDPDPASSHRITDSQLVTETCHEHVTRDSLLWDYATLLLIHFILPNTHRFLTVNIYWWHSHESLILTDLVSSNSVPSVLKVSCRAPLFAPVQLRACQCSLSICSLPNRNMGQFLHRFVTTRHWLCGIVNE